MQADAGDAADQPVGDKGRHLAQEQPVLAVLAPADQKIEWMRANPRACVQIDEMVERIGVCLDLTLEEVVGRGWMD